MAAALVAALAPPAYGGTASLAWNPVPDTDVAGYRIYYGTATGAYTQSSDVGDVTQATISGLTDCTNYFLAVKAYDTSGNQSPSYSNEIQGWSRPVVAYATPSAAEQGRTLTLTIAGSNFQTGATAVFSDSGITVNSTTVNTCGQLTVSVTIGTTATAGASNLDVTNSDGTFGTGTAVFTVQAATAPTLASTAPADGATGAPTSVTPTVTFSEAMLGSSITATNIKLLDSTGAAVAQRAGSPALSANGLTATIVPVTGLMQGETYRIQVVGGAAGVVDIANHGMASTFTQTIGFATAADTTAPTILRFEAESGTLVAPVRTNTGAADAFGSGYIDTPAGTPNGSATSPAGMATFGVNIPSDGIWYLWVRMYGQDAGTDSWYESMNGAARQQLVPTVTGQWQWVAARPYALTAGLSSLELGAGNAQARADRVLLTDDSTFVPSEQPLDDQTPPASDTGVTATGGAAQVTLAWTNSSSIDFSQTIIRYRTDGQFPVSPVDGFAVVVKTGAVGSTDSFVHTGLTNGTAYFYSAFAQDTSGNVSSAANATAIPGDVPPPSPVIALVQHAAKDAGTVTSSSLAFPANNTAGDLIAVVIRVGRSNAVISVEDTGGNFYRQAAKLDVTVDEPYGDTLAIFYAENVQPGVNTVNVFSSLVGGSLRFAILEYAGVARSDSLDGTSSAQGNDSTPTSGSTTTTSNGDLLLGAVMTGDSGALTPEGGFTLREQVADKLLAEDRIQTRAGPASAGATLVADDAWGATVAAFRAGPPIPQPDLALTKTHAGTFVQGQCAATYTLTVTNVGSATSVGTVTVTDTVPAGLIPTDMDGAGWSCNLATTTCTRLDGLAASGSYPSIVLTVSVAADAASSVTNTASVSGGSELNTDNDTASDVTPIDADTQSPTVPSGLTATTATDHEVDLNWTAATDNVGVTGYRIEQCQGTACTDFTEIAQVESASYSVTGLDSGTYRYRVRAEDAPGNLGPYSDVASVTIPAIWLVQHRGLDAGDTESSSLAFTSTNGAGNLIVVAIRTGRSSQALTVTDSLGNTYREAIQLHNTFDGMAVAIYYAENISGGSNAVTVSKPQPDGGLRFAIFEYSGIALTASLDQTAGAEGSSAMPDSGIVTPTSDGQLVIGVVATVDEDTFTRGAGYVINETVPAAPHTKLIVEDQTQAASSSVSAGATLGASTDWAAVVATFRAARANELSSRTRTSKSGRSSFTRSSPE